MTGTSFDEHERLRWSGRAEPYQRSFARLCAHPAGDLLDAAGVGPGTRVIDVGAGPGTVAALACARGATVVAVDPEPSMLELARHKAPTAAVSRALLPHLPFPDHGFDAAVANFVLNHVGEPAAAVAELCRVVRAGGQVAVTIWPYPQPPLQRLWGEAFAASGAPRPAHLPRLEPDHDFPRTVEGLAGLLRRANLRDVRCRTVEWTHHTDPEDWWSGPAGGIGHLGLLLEHQSVEMIGRIRREYDRLSAGYRTTTGELALPTAALLAVGEIPPDSP